MAGIALPTVAELFKGTVEESLKKLVQPIAIVPATLLVVLNLVMIYPIALAKDWGPAQTFDDLDDIWKAVVAGVLVLVIGYLILNLAPSVLRLATGESWTRTWLYRALSAQAAARSDALVADAIHAYTSGDMVSYRRARAEEARLPGRHGMAPTQLGNVFAGMGTSIENRYGIDAGALWPHLGAVMAKEGLPLHDVIEEEANSVQLLLAVSVVLASVALEAIIVNLLVGNWARGAASTIALPLAYLVYRAAVARARSYVDGIEAAFDLYRDELAKAMGIEIPEAVSEAREAWNEVSASLLYDKEPEPKEAPSSESVVLSSSENAHTTALETTIDEPVIEPLGVATSTLRRTWRRHYLIGITSSVEEPATVYVAVRDADLLERPLAVPDTPSLGVRITGETLAPREKAGAGIVWHVRDLAPRSAVVLDYRLVVALLEIRMVPAGRKVSLVDEVKSLAKSVKVNVTEDPNLPVGGASDWTLWMRASWLIPGKKVLATIREGERATGVKVLEVDQNREVSWRINPLGPLTVELQEA